MLKSFFKKVVVEILIELIGLTLSELKEAVEEWKEKRKQKETNPDAG